MICQSFTVTSFWLLAIRILHYWCYGLIRDRKQCFPTTERKTQQRIRFQHTTRIWEPKGLWVRWKPWASIILTENRPGTFHGVSLTSNSSVWLCPASLRVSSSGVPFLYAHILTSCSQIDCVHTPLRDAAEILDSSFLYLHLSLSLSLHLSSPRSWCLHRTGDGWMDKQHWMLMGSLAYNPTSLY